MTTKHIIYTLIAAALIIAPIQYYTRDKLPQRRGCPHAFGKWSDAKTDGIWPMQFHYCAKCGIAERRTL